MGRKHSQQEFVDTARQAGADPIEMLPISELEPDDLDDHREDNANSDCQSDMFPEEIGDDLY